jgi:hypothetical protein
MTECRANKCPTQKTVVYINLYAHASFRTNIPALTDSAIHRRLYLSQCFHEEIPVRHFSWNLYVFPNPEKNQSRNQENNQCGDFTGSNESTDVKSKAREGNADTRSRRLRSTFESLRNHDANLLTSRGIFDVELRLSPRWVRGNIGRTDATKTWHNFKVYIFEINNRKVINNTSLDSLESHIYNKPSFKPKSLNPSI